MEGVSVQPEKHVCPRKKWVWKFEVPHVRVFRIRHAGTTGRPANDLKIE